MTQKYFFSLVCFFFFFLYDAESLWFYFMSHFDLDTYNYDLPPELVAQLAVKPAHDARLLIVQDSIDSITHTSFFSLDKHVSPNAVFILNNSRVLRSRFVLKNQEIIYNGTKGIISKWEIFFLRYVDSNSFEALIQPGNKFRVGTFLEFAGLSVEVLSITETGRVLRVLQWSISHAMEAYWELPLPPYIEYTKQKEEDYQTNFATKPWSVAAPTASLHFSEELLQKLPQQKLFVTLHVGLGTFKWIQESDIRNYMIHKEEVEVDISLFQTIAELKISERPIVAVWTTVCRTLESLPYVWNCFSEHERTTFFSSETQKFWNNLKIYKNSYIASYAIENSNVIFECQLYITPDFHFQIIDELITNFHLPKSSLLVLVSSFLWIDAIKKIYQIAIKEKYRFFSFWDGMYIKKWKSFQSIGNDTSKIDTDNI